MNEMFISKRDVAYAAKDAEFGGGVIADANEIDQLAPGAIAVFLEDNTLVTTATPAADVIGKKQFYVAQGIKTPSTSQHHKYPRRSRLIDRDAYNRFYKEYDTPVKKIMVVGADSTPPTAGTGLFLPNFLIPDSVLSIRIYRESQEELNKPLWGKFSSNYPATRAMRVETIVLPGDTLTTALQRLVDKINNHPENVYLNNPNSTWLKATLIGTDPDFGIKLESLFDYQDFGVTTDDILSNASKTVTQNISYGHGDWRQINEIEESYNIELGDSNRIHYSNFYFSAGKQVEQDERYDTFSLEWKVETRNSINVQPASIQRVTIAVPSGDAVKDTLDTIFALINQPVTTSTGGGGASSNF